jgi:hypothetical protein
LVAVLAVVVDEVVDGRMAAARSASMVMAVLSEGEVVGGSGAGGMVAGVVVGGDVIHAGRLTAAARRGGPLVLML